MLESHFGLDNPDGSRSSLLQATVQVGDKVYSIPTVRNGQILGPRRDQGGRGRGLG